MSARAAAIRAPRPFGPRAWIAPASVAALVFLAAPTGAHTIAGAGVLVLDASPEQERIVTWAIGRYRGAGLELPPIVVGFHTDPRDCGNNSGYTVGGRIDICTTGTRAYVRATLLHEVAHVWLEHHASEELRMSLLRLRGLKTWDASEAPWGLRGVEQAAEIIAWGLGDGTHPPLIPDDDPDGLTLAFELLTGGRPLNPEGSGVPSGDEEQAMSRKVSERALSPKGLVSLLAWIAIVLATVALTVGILRPSRVERCPSSTRGRDSPTGSGSERCGSR